ncbi:MAG: PQQ-like beta-propeller repeat protein [Bacteroidales bacterium]|nr:PQQ-like beta-propeller repeat protein [Bacteroidales bacterium]
MKRISFIGKLLLVAAAGMFALSCDKGNRDEDSVVSLDRAFFILNEGSYLKNNASVTRYNPETKRVESGVFEEQNGAGLGDTGQDVLAVGDELYISVNVSQHIRVTDRNLKSKAVISPADAPLSPRYLCQGGGKVYVTYYEGFLGEIDPATRAVRTVAVGPNPDGVVYANGKIYTADSGGYLDVPNTSLSVVDASSFTRTGSITVNSNPTSLVLCAGALFVYSYGSYKEGIPAKLQRVDLSTQQVTDIDYDSVSGIAARGDMLYVLCGGYDEQWNPLPGRIYKYDAARGQKAGEFVTDGTVIANAYKICATEHFIWATASDYTNNGDVYAFNPADGKLVAKLDSKGVNPSIIVE